MPEVRTVRMPSESPVALIIFIVATVLLLILSFFLYQGMASRQTTLDELQAGLQREVYDPLKQANKNPEMETSPAAPTPYGAQFFGLLGKTVKWGLQYERMIELVGYPGDTAVEDTRKLLKDSAGTSSIAVKDFIKSLKDQKDRLDEQVKQAAATEKKLQEQIQAEKENVTKAIQDKVAENEKLTKQVAEKEKELGTLRSEMKTKLDAAQEEVAKAQKEYSDKKAALDEEEKAFVAKLDANIKDLRERLAKMGRKLPPRIDVPSEEPIKARIALLGDLMAVVLQPTAVAVQAVAQEGRIVSVNLKLKTAYLSMGAMDGVKLGTVYTVYERGKAGKLVDKGDIEVVKLDNVTSTAGIVRSDRLNPIVAGDIVMPKAPEVAAAKVPKAAPKAAPAPPPPRPKPKEDMEDEEKNSEKEEAKEEKKEDGNKDEDKEEGKKEDAKEEEKKEAKEDEKKEDKEEKAEEGKKSDEKPAEEKKTGASGPAVKAIMAQLALAGKAIQEAYGAKNWDVVKAKGDEIAAAGDQAQGGEGVNDEMKGMYKAMAEGGSELSVAAADKKEDGAMAAMKKVAGSCGACHAKYKKT